MRKKTMSEESGQSANAAQWVKSLRGAVRRYRRNRGIIFGVRVAITGLFFVLFTFFVYGATLPPDAVFDGATALRRLASSEMANGALFGLFGLVIVAWAVAPERRYPALNANALDLRDIEALAHALKLPDAEVRGYAAEKLCPLLDRVMAENAACLAPETRQILCDCLRIERARTDFALLIAILSLLTKIGDDEAMPAVRRLATAEFCYNAEERTVMAARDCLRVLHGRHVKKRERTTLLRPSASETPTEELLRPANASDTPPELLLRVAPLQ